MQHSDDYQNNIEPSCTNLSDLGESLFALVNEELWPINQVCADLIA